MTSPELEAALAAVAEAGKFALDEYSRFVPIPDAPASISTHVDRGAQELILNRLRAAYPAYGVIAEERTPAASGAPLDAERVWIVDPIDGTRGFAMKMGEFSIMVGLLENHEPILGVVYEPVIDRWAYASKGEGCWTRTGDAEPQRCSVSKVERLEEAALVVSHRKPGKPLKGAALKLGPARLVESYSAGIKLALVARGEVEAYANEYSGFFDWDIAPGHILVAEAGGRVTDNAGQPIRYGLSEPPTRQGMIATNGVLHDSVLERLKG